jgi:chaperonin cofactor prefoldin
MDKDTIVSKIIQENNQLATDLEHFQVSYYDSKRALEEMKSQYDDAMKEAKLARSEVEELKENAGIYIFSFLYG